MYIQYIAVDYRYQIDDFKRQNFLTRFFSETDFIMILNRYDHSA